MKKQLIFLSAAVVATFTCALSFSAKTSAASASYGTCGEVHIPVATVEGSEPSQTVGATFCTPLQWATGAHTMDIMVAGATYNRSYWDWPQNPGLYSFVDRTLQAGRATLAFDRLGTGTSSRIVGGGLTQTVQTDAYVLHQLVSWLHAQGYEQVNGIGHSLGSVVLTKEAATYKDFNKIVVTGALHLPAISTNAPNFATSLYPAALDPVFSSSGYDLTYLTSLPDRRGSTFYDPVTADPAVIAYDEAHKDVATTGELLSSITELETPAVLNTTRDITASVLVVMGQTDNIFCNFTVDCSQASSVAAAEQPYYASAAHFEALTIPQTAHNLTLHPSAGQSFAAINAWIKE